MSVAGELRAPVEVGVLGIPGPVAHGLMLGITLATLAWILHRRLVLLLRAAPDPRFDRIGERVRRLLIVGFGQSRQPRHPVPGVLHILIFYGFLVLVLRSLTLLGEGFVAGFALPGLGGAAGDVYAAAKDWTALVVLACCAVAAFRRAVVKPARYHDRHAVRSHGAEAYAILGLIALLMVADAVFEGSAMARAGEQTWGLPLASSASFLLGGASESVLGGLHVGGFWVHNVALCFFACHLPVSKHFHVITALPNVFLSKLPPQGRVKPVRYGAVEGPEPERFGVRALEDLTWKHLLDVYSCTDCGRCSHACPAYKIGTPLSPRMLSIKCRDEAYATYPIFGAPPAGRRAQSAGERPPLVGGVIKDEELWACTTCGACEETCPVMIEYVDKIVDMRRALVEDGRVPAGLQKALAAVEKRGNPYGLPARKRGDWVNGGGGADGEDASVRVLAPGDEAELCWFTDSATAFDPRIQAVGRALARVLARAGVDVGTLGKDEVDSGHEVRRVGEEGLFEVLREKNLDALGERTFRRVLTSDPHAFNALRNDYGIEQPVLHHSQLLAELIDAGRLRLGRLDDGRTYTFHDPCYLGRHNGEFEAPRRVLAAVGNVRTVEMERCKSRSFCCGGGSLYLFHESESDEHMGAARVAMAEAAGAQVIVTACPFCLIHFEDAIKTTGRAERMEVLDLAELVALSLDGAGPRAAPEPAPA